MQKIQKQKKLIIALVIIVISLVVGFFVMSGGTGNLQGSVEAVRKLKDNNGPTRVEEINYLKSAKLKINTPSTLNLQVGE
ncbi:hypothetical protein KKC94_03990 [Patescibacteria group bacterium]|nr:hypothetical protein [Patescibacteria group bacterium]